MDIVYKDFNILSEDQVKNLYTDAGWTTYTKSIKNLLSGIQNSDFVYSAWHENQLIGLIRVVSDQSTICYVQDLLVLKKYRGQGIGKHLLKTVLEKYKNVRQIVLITDEDGPIDFYEDMGFERTNNKHLLAMVKLKKEE